MRSKCRILFKKKRLQCATKTANLHERIMQFVSEQVPRCWSGDSVGATAVRIELKPWNNNGGWRNEDAVVQQLERPVYIAQPGSLIRWLANCTPSPQACM